MNLVIFASLIVFIIWLAYELKKTEDKSISAERKFWEREAAANGVRKKNLDHLPYIHFPFDRLPSEESFLSAGIPVPESLSILKSLEGKPMVNFSGLSNTDLKLQYGTANITVLSSYDETFEIFSRNIYELAETLEQAGRTQEALFLLEETLAYGTDISGHYKLLAGIYLSRKEKEKVIALKQRASCLNSLTKNTILSYLDEIIAQM